LGLAGYLVSAPLLFPEYFFAGVAVHTATGLLVSSQSVCGLPGSGSSGRGRRSWRGKTTGSRSSARRSWSQCALAAGIASFAVLQGRAQTLVGNNVLAALTRRTDMFRDLVELRESNARLAATRPAVLRNLRIIHAGRDDGSNMANVRAVVDSFLKEGFSGLAYHDVDGKMVAGGGVFARNAGAVGYARHARQRRN